MRRALIVGIDYYEYLIKAMTAPEHEMTVREALVPPTFVRLSSGSILVRDGRAFQAPLGQPDGSGLARQCSSTQG